MSTTPPASSAPGAVPNLGTYYDTTGKPFQKASGEVQGAYYKHNANLDGAYGECYKSINNTNGQAGIIKGLNE